MFLNKQKKAQITKGNRILITINFLGSAGPMRFVVYDGELVATVIDMALKSYSREGRLPILGSNLSDFVLYCPAAGSDALSQWETIGSHGSRNFILCKKPQAEEEVVAGARAATPVKGWRAESRRGAAAGRPGSTNPSPSRSLHTKTTTYI